MHQAAPCTRRGSIIMLLLMSVIMIMLVIAFSFLRSMQMSRGATLVQRKDDLARLAAEMGMQHAASVCLHAYAMSNEVRDDMTVPAVSRFDAPDSNVFKLMSSRLSSADISNHPPQPYDMSPELPFQNMFDSGALAGPRTVGYTWGVINKSGYSRLTEANRFSYDATRPSSLYDPASYDLYDPAAPNPAVVKTAFPPVDPFVRGAALIKRHPSDNPLLLDADFRPVIDARDARYRLRYAVDIQDMSAALWLNTDMPWLTAVQKAQARTAYKECFYAVGTQLRFDYNPADTFENILLGHGAAANARFVNGQAREWPERGGGPMWYRGPNQWNQSQRINHCVFGSPFMNWNDPPSKGWIGSAIPSFNDLGFALQDDSQNWHEMGEVKDNEPRVRGDKVAQFAGTPFGRPDGAATDHPWALNALIIAPRVLEAMVAAYMPPVVRSVAVTTEWCTPYCKTVDAFGNVNTSYRGSPIAGVANPTAWSIPIKANLTIPGSGPDLFTNAFTPLGQTPFPYATPPMRDYWTTPVGPAAAPSTWRCDHTPVSDTRTNAQRYPGTRFFSVLATEPMGQCLTRWRGKNPDGTPYDSIALACLPRQTDSDPASSNPPAPPWALGTAYAVDDRVSYLGEIYVCNSTVDVAAAANPGNGPGGATTRFVLEAPISVFPPAPGGDHLGRHIIFYKPDYVDPNPGNSILAVKNTVYKYLSVANFNSINAPNWWLYPGDNINNSSEFMPGGPFSPGISGAGTDGFVSAYKGSSWTVYSPPVPVIVNGEVYPCPDWGNPSPPATPAALLATQVTAAQTPPPARGPLGVVNPEGWQISRAAGSWGSPAKSTVPNSYYNRLSLAFWHAVFVAQAANMSWADRQDCRSQAFAPGSANVGDFGVYYATNPDQFDFTSYKRKGPASWSPAAADFDSVEQIDRQFVANMGESFTQPGHVTPTQASASRPPRYLGKQTYTPKFSTNWCGGRDGNSYCYTNYNNMRVAEYCVTNNIRTLLDPLDTRPGGALTAFSTDPQLPPPHNIWLLDEWNAEAEAGYIPGVNVGAQPTTVARARAKMMERVLNDWRLSFLGSSKAYAASFLPKDFDGDGKVFCSGYLTPNAADPDCGLTCWKSADASGNGPGKAAGDLTIYSVTGCLTITRSHQFKIHVRGELYDNFLDRAVSEQYLESAVMIDPDDNITRGALPSGLADSVLIMQRPIHSYYRGFLNRAYP